MNTIDERLDKLARTTETLVDFLTARVTLKELAGHLRPQNPFDDTPTSEPPEEPVPRIVLYSMADAMQPQPARDWVVKGLLEAGDVGILSAWTGSGKTWIAYELGTAHALGAAWEEFETTQGTTLIVNEEMGERDLKIRLAMCNRAKFGDENTPVYWVSFGRFNFLSEKTAVHDVELLEDVITRSQARLVIIDALADVMAGGNENDVKDTQPVFMRLSEIARKTGAAILVIHHCGKNGQTRGSSAIPGAVDLVIKMTRSEDSPFVNFETEKARNISAIKWVAKMTWTPDQFYTDRFYPEENGREKLTPKEQAVTNYLDDCEGKRAGTKEIETFTGVSRYTLINMAKKGVVKNIQTEKGREAIYEIC